MPLLKNLLIKLYHTGAIRYFRSETKRKLTSILTPVQNTLNAHSANLNNLLDITNALAQQQRQHLSLMKLAEDKQDLHTRLLNEANNKHNDQLHFLKDVHDRQGFSAYLIYREELLEKFISVTQAILADSFPLIQQYIEPIFTEILIGLMTPGGIWQFRETIQAFQKLPPQEEPHPVIRPAKPSTPLKILIVSGCFPSIMHGGGGRLLDIILELSKDHQVDLFTHYNQEQDESSLQLLQGKVDNIHLVTDFSKLNIQTVASWLRTINRAAKYYDIIQLEYPQTIRFIPHLRQYGRKIGFTFMECLSLSYTEKLEETLRISNNNSISTYARLFWEAVADEKFAMEEADYTISVTSKDANFLGRLSNRPTHIIPTCVSNFAILDEAQNCTFKQEKNSVLFVGFFGHWPNKEAVEWYLSNIHPKIRKAIPGYIFTIVGSGDVTDIREITKGDDSVVVTGMVESVVPYILKSKVCVSPLISGAGIRGKQNQYAALGRPSVTTSIGNKGLPYKNNESVLIADSASDFAKSVINLLCDKTLYNKLQDNATEIATANYTWPVHVANLLKIYQA